MRQLQVRATVTQPALEYTLRVESFMNLLIAVAQGLGA
jgi:hypothetical protein